MDLTDDKIDGGAQGSGKKCGTFIKVEQSGVRRKLFQEDGTDGNESYHDFVAMNICNEQGAQLCQRNWSRVFKTDVTRENETFDKERKDISVLVISNCKDIALMKMIETNAKLAINNIALLGDISHSFPESAYRLASLRHFSLIFLDLNCEFVESSLKVSLSIRSSSVTNKSTPIVALRHADPLKDEIWKKHGVSEIIYGPLYHSTVGQICERYLNAVIERDLADEDGAKNNTILPKPRQSEFKVPSVPPSNKYTNEGLESAAQQRVWPASRNESPIQACDSTDQITPYCESDATGATVQVQVEHCSDYDNEKTPSIQGSSSTYSVNCIMPLSVNTTARPIPMDNVVNNNGAVTQSDAHGSKTNSSGWNFIQQILDLHQNVQKDIDQKSKQVVHPLENNTPDGAKTATTQPPATVYPTVPQHPTAMKSYPGTSTLSSQMPQNSGYMISGTPEAGNMKLSLIPDEYAKHSNKERERRERIKESCDELRKILPRQLMMGRRQDMATVLEMTVFYLRVVQDHLPTVIQQQLYQSFMTYAESKQKRKRKAGDVLQTLPCMVQTKLQRLGNGSTSTSSSGYPPISYGTSSYIPQMMPPSNYQQGNPGYFSPLYHPLLTNPYHTAVNASSIPSVYGSGSLPSLDHVMHLRSQYYNENQPTQNGIPCYVTATSSPRDSGNSTAQRQEQGKSSFIN